MEYFHTQANKEFIASSIKQDYQKIKHPKWDKSKQFSKDICMKAETQYTIMQQSSSAGWRSKIIVYKEDNMIFDLCRAYNGIPKDLFLKGFLVYRPVINSEKFNCTNLLNECSHRLHPNAVSLNKLSESLNSLDKLCSIFTTVEWNKEATQWLLSNSTDLWENLAACLVLNNHPIVPELCIGIAFIVCKTRDNITDDILIVFENLTKVISDCCLQFDEYFRNLHGDLAKLNTENIDFIVLSSALYCQTFLINYNFTETMLTKLMDMFEMVSEMGRHIYYNIIGIVVRKIKDLMDFKMSDSKWLHILEMISERISNLQEEDIAINKNDSIKILQNVRNSIFSKVPNYVHKFRRRTSAVLENKVILSRRKIKDGSERDPEMRSSYINGLFHQGTNL